VAPALGAARLRTDLGERFLIVSPGIRPADNQIIADDQKRTVTAERAFQSGADYIVVGRPIRDALDPVHAAQEIQSVISRLFAPAA
jgi:orotidine-5'-phosphate decarboxylase